MLLFPKQNVFIFPIKEFSQLRNWRKYCFLSFKKNKVTVNTSQVQILKEDFEIVGGISLILRERIALAANSLPAHRPLFGIR